METVNIVRKISTASLGFKKTLIRKLLADKEEKQTEVHLYDVVGNVHKIENGESTYGPWTAFKGEIAAIVASQTDLFKQGETVRSSKAFIPEPFSGLLESQLNSTEEAVEFAVRIFVQECETAIGYEYVVKPVVKIQSSDTLGHLLEKLDSVTEQPATPETKEPKTGKKK